MKCILLPNLSQGPPKINRDSKESLDLIIAVIYKNISRSNIRKLKNRQGQYSLPNQNFEELFGMCVIGLYKSIINVSIVGLGNF